MSRRPLAGFRAGSGLASPALILVWLALGVGLIWLQWNMGLAGVEEHSGIVKAVTVDPAFGMHVKIDSSSIDFFFGSTEFPQSPDIRVGDHVDVLSESAPLPGWADAAQSQRGTWIATIHGDEVAPFTPATWPLHEAMRWSALALGILVAAFGVTSLIRWVPSTRRHATPVRGTSLSNLQSQDAASRVAIGPEPAQALDTSERVQDASLTLPRQVRDPARVGVWVGVFSVIALPIIDFVGISTAGPCALAWWADWVFKGVPILLALGGITSLILASLSTSGSVHRLPARVLGIIALAMALLSIAINFVAAISCVAFF
jgi:hypothetical protein